MSFKAGPRGGRRTAAPAQVALLAGRADTAPRAPARSPGARTRPVAPERVADVVGDAPGDRDQLVVAVRARAGHRGLDQVAVGVQLVPPLEVAVADVRRLVAVARVEVAVGLLRARRRGRDLPDHRVELGVAVAPDLPREPFRELVDVRVGEQRPAEVARHAALGRGAEVLDPAHALDPAVRVTQDHVAVELLALAPEAAVELDLGHPERVQRTCRRRHGAPPLLAHPRTAPDMNPLT